MPTGQRGGTETYWCTWGDSTPEVMLIHCTLAHSGAWNGLVAHLNQPSLAFDLPDHGRSGPWEKSQDLQTQSLAIARDFITTPMDVIGHSFGATVALRLAIESPHLVKRLVLIEPVLFAAARGTAAFEEHLTMMRPMDEAMKAGDMETAAQLFTGMWGTGVPWESMRPEHRTALQDQMHLVRAQDGSIFQDNAGLLTPDRLEAVDCPTLFVEGAESPPIIGAINEVLAGRMPNTARRKIPGAQHMAPITHDALVADQIRSFWAANP